jgi:pimeloyl-ACP methyl ester carboxylesterase
LSAAGAVPATFETAEVPLWREALFGIDWLSLRLSPVYYGIGVPHGTGDPVIVVPGFLGSDNYLVEMYNWLRRIGYKPYYSRIGRNAECPDVLRDRLFETMDKVFDENGGRKIHLIGHSLGGLLARAAASRRPEQVSQVICLAAPFRDIKVHPMVLAAAGFVRGRIVGQRENGNANGRRRQKRVERACYTGNCTCDFAQALREDLPSGVQRVAIYTETDGVVDWRSCIEEDERFNIRVDGTHAGLAFNPQVYRRVAELLAAVSGRPKRKRT